MASTIASASSAALTFDLIARCSVSNSPATMSALLLSEQC